MCVSVKIRQFLVVGLLCLIFGNGLLSATDYVVTPEARAPEAIGAALAQSGIDRALIVLGDSQWGDEQAMPWIPAISVSKETPQDAFAAWCTQAHVLKATRDGVMSLTISGNEKSLTQKFLLAECPSTKGELPIREIFTNNFIEKLEKLVNRPVELEIGASPRARFSLVPSQVDRAVSLQVPPIKKGMSLRAVLAQQIVAEGGVWIIWTDVPVDVAEAAILHFAPFTTVPIPFQSMDKVLSEINHAAMALLKGMEGKNWVAAMTISIARALAADRAQAFATFQASDVLTILWTDTSFWAGDLLKKLIALNDPDIMRCLQKSLADLPIGQRLHALNRLPPPMDVGPKAKIPILAWWNALAADPDEGVKNLSGTVLADPANAPAP